MPVFKNKESLPQKISDNFERRITCLDNLMVVVCDFKNGPMDQPEKPHSHSHEQITYVARGDLDLFLEEKKYHLTEGDIFTVPSDIPHCIRTRSEFVRLIDSFTPLREDFINYI